MARRTPHRNSRIIKHKVADGIYLLRFKTQYELTSTFLRVQEPSIRSAAAAQAGIPASGDVDVFAALRRWKDEFRAPSP